MDYQKLADEVVRKLREEITECVVELFPDQFSNYKFAHAKCALLVAVYGGPFDRHNQIAVQHLTVEIHVITRMLNGISGALAYLNRVEDALFQFRPDGASTNMFPSTSRFISYVESPAIEWTYLHQATVDAIYYGKKQ